MQLSGWINTGSQSVRLLDSLPGMPKRKRRTKKETEPAPATGKRKRRTGKSHKTTEPVPVATAKPDNAPKTVMDRIFEAQRQELDRLNAELQKKVTG